MLNIMKQNGIFGYGHTLHCYKYELWLLSYCYLVLLRWNSIDVDEFEAKASWIDWIKSVIVVAEFPLLYIAMWFTLCGLRLPWWQQRWLPWQPGITSWIPVWCISQMLMMTNTHFTWRFQGHVTITRVSS